MHDTPQPPDLKVMEGAPKEGGRQGALSRQHVTAEEHSVPVYPWPFPRSGRLHDHA